MYTGTTAPTPNTYYRATRLTVDYQGSGSEAGSTETTSWDDADVSGRYAGNAQFSFSGGDGITIGSNNPTVGGVNAIENLEGHITVNAASYVDSTDPQYQADDAGSVSNSGDGADFIGYKQTYKIRYTVNVTLKDGGLIRGTKSEALGSWIDVSVENKHYRIYFDSV